MIDKKCRECGKEKPATLEYFHKKRDNPDGLCLYCKECISEKSRLYHQENRDKLLAKNKAYYENNREKLCAQKRQYRKENTEKVKASAKKYRENNKEIIAKRKQQYHYANRDRILKYLEDYRSDPANRAKHKAYCSTYSKINRARLRKAELFRHKILRATKMGLPATFTPKEWKHCKRYFDNTCAYCGASNIKLEQEHFIPESSGGGYEKSNIIPACRSCNQSKLNRNFNEWYPSYEFYSAEREQKIFEYLNKEVNKKNESHEAGYNRKFSGAQTHSC